jgi:hypothetical protein
VASRRPSLGASRGRTREADGWRHLRRALAECSRGNRENGRLRADAGARRTTRERGGSVLGRDAPSSGHIMRRHLAVRAEAPWKWSRGPRLAAQSR